MENIQITNVRSLGAWEWDFTDEGVADISGAPQHVIGTTPDIQVSSVASLNPATTRTVAVTTPQPGCSHWVTSTNNSLEGSPVMYNVADLEPHEKKNSDTIEISDTESETDVMITPIKIHSPLGSIPDIISDTDDRSSPDPEVIWEMKERPDHPEWMGAPYNPPMVELKPPNEEIIIITDSDSD